jgi:hypothetical protein
MASMARNFDMCKTCKDYDFLDKHRCLPKWLVQIHEHHEMDDTEDAMVVHAVDAEGAASKGLERWDEERDALTDGYLVRVVAEDEEATTGEWFSVTAQQSIEYSAESVSAPSTPLAEP